MGGREELASLIGRTVEGLGYEMVDVERAGGGLLRVSLDAAEGSGAITVNDCERVSHQLTHMLAVEGVDYARLEVGSPGLDRPLKKVRDFARFAGAEIKVELHAPLEGRRRWHARLIGLAGDQRVQLELLDDAERPAQPGARDKPGKKTEQVTRSGRKVEFALTDIDKARLVPVLNFRSGR